MSLPLIDAHCHLHDERLWSNGSQSSRHTFEGVLSRARTTHVSHVVSCATHEQDWKVLEQLMQRETSPRIVPAFGVHPWWARDLVSMTGESLASLRDTLVRYPTASVGEIGLCKSARGKLVPIDVQVEAFRMQLELAAELERSCVLHCVGYYGKLLEILIDVRRAGRLPPVLVLHSYSGPPDMVRSFLALRGTGTRVFFSLNAKQLTDPRMKKAAACCKKLPLEALVLETDAPDQAPSVESIRKLFNDENETADGPLLLQDASAAISEPAMVKLALHSAAEIRGVAADELAVAVYQNCQEAFGINDSTLS
ncbi:TatD related DNase [Phytophthora megakarya]|uniref:TatD related DNase n=1 Tax=Phytophthora megakarya TaxID=4795 RepID=A0A225X278_9STRA|nr:TatD related DNase [Phytophthora megakarya]